MNSHQYKQQVALLIRIIPLVYQIKEFAIHGGTAINLFHQNMPRYSVDIDITYIPIEPRLESLKQINTLLQKLKNKIERTVPGILVVHKQDILKLQCSYNGATVKIEVNSIKRGILGKVEIVELCPKARDEFQANCKAQIVPYSQLYGGKIAAALSRQHPRDLFDCQYIREDMMEILKDGLLLSLLGSDKPIIESLAPNAIDQQEALENQFRGMTEIPFSYNDYTIARNEIIQKANRCLTQTDKQFILSFEEGVPDWGKCSAGDLRAFPSVQWKLLNIKKLQQQNYHKYQDCVTRLKEYFNL